MSAEDMFEGMENFEHKEYAEEARERWGDTEAYQESMRRTRRYSKEDWTPIKAESDAITASLAAAMRAGKSADDADVKQLADQHRLHIDRWFYPCSHEFHVNLGEMYVADPRFTATYDRVEPGLARFIRDAIVANAGNRA